MININHQRTNVLVVDQVHVLLFKNKASYFKPRGPFKPKP